MEYENNPNNIMLESIKWVIKIFENKLGIKITVSEEALKNLIKYFNENVTINDEEKEKLESNCSKEEIEQYSLFESQMNTMLTSMKFENVMKDLFYFNDNIRNNINAYCLLKLALIIHNGLDMQMKKKDFVLSIPYLPKLITILLKFISNNLCKKKKKLILWNYF